MSKRSFVTNITPLPRTISRETAIELLHDHASMIELNPLVIRHVPTVPPSGASRDEAENATWYEITDQVNYLPGGAMKSEISYKACFYNLPRGLQTHVFAPAGLDMKGKWLVCGNMPGEPKDPPELGVDAPREGLYIREDVDMRCNVLLTNFVKRNLKKSHRVVIDRIIARVGKTKIKHSDPSMDNAAIYSRAPSVLSHMTSGPSAMMTADHRGQRHEQVPIVHSSYPPHCACVGTAHDPSCSFFSPEDLNSAGLGQSISAQQPFYAMSIPSSTSSYSQSSSPNLLPGRGRPYPELYGSSTPDQCQCTGALHEKSCASYPGLRSGPLLADQRALSGAPPTVTASAPAQTALLPPPSFQAHSAPGVGRVVSPQLYGEQAELPATARSPIRDEWTDRDQVRTSEK